MKKFLVILLSLIIIGFGIVLGLYYSDILKKPEKREPKVEEKQEPKVENYKLSLFAVGDALIHDGVYIDANTYKKVVMDIIFMTFLKCLLI